MNLQDQIRIREKIMRLQEQLSCVLIRLDEYADALNKVSADLARVKEQTMALLVKKPVGRPRKNG